LSSLVKRSVLLSGHATSVALEPEFWAVLDIIAGELALSRSSLLSRMSAGGGLRPRPPDCRILALQWVGGDRSFAEEKTS